MTVLHVVKTRRVGAKAKRGKGRWDTGIGGGKKPTKAGMKALFDRVKARRDLAKGIPKGNPGRRRYEHLDNYRRRMQAKMAQAKRGKGTVWDRARDRFMQKTKQKARQRWNQRQGK